jgi:hypothetical protein
VFSCAKAADPVNRTIDKAVDRLSFIIVFLFSLLIELFYIFPFSLFKNTFNG